MDGVVVGCRDDTFVGEDETSNNGATVRGKGNMFGVEVVDPFCPGEVTRFEQDLVRVRARE